MEAHLGHMCRWIKAYLALGSTGDGWELNEEESHQVLTFDIDMAEKFNFQLLIGVLRTDAEMARQSIVDTLAWLRERTGIRNKEEMMKKPS